MKVIIQKNPETHPHTPTPPTHAHETSNKISSLSFRSCWYIKYKVAPKYEAGRISHAIYLLSSVVFSPL